MDQVPAGHEAARPVPMAAAHHCTTGDLGTLLDAAYDRTWPMLMVDHYRGATDTARTEIGQGADSGAKAMAQRITDTRQADVDRMTGLLIPAWSRRARTTLWRARHARGYPVGV